MTDHSTATPDHVVIVGAGIGGLSAALRLAHAGLSVDVVEMADGPGGKMRTLPSEVGAIDIGPTVMTMRPVFEELFADVGERLGDHVSLVRDDVLARHHWRDGSSLDLFHDRDASAEAVRVFAGARAEQQFLAFSARAKALFEAFEAPVMHATTPKLGALTGHVLRQPGLIPAMAPGLSLARSLKAQFSDPRLRQLFGRYATYVGGSPYQSPAVLGLIWHSEASGVWSIPGGLHGLARAMNKLAMARGARFHFNTKVEEITMRGDRTHAVRLSDGRTLPARTVLFNGDPKALHDGLLGAAARVAVPARSVKARSLSAYVWGFAAKPHGLRLSHHNVFFCDDPRIEFADATGGRLPRDASLYICAQDRGGGAEPDGIERFEIIMNGPAGHKPTLEERDLCRTRTFETLQKMGLTFSPQPRDEHLTTPQDFAEAFPGSDGSLYGLSPHGMMATFARPTASTRIKGLYLCGGGAHPGAGIPMACLSGKHAAEAILTSLASTSTSRRMDTLGGMSTASATMVSAQSRSSAS